VIAWKLTEIKLAWKLTEIKLAWKLTDIKLAWKLTEIKLVKNWKNHLSFFVSPLIDFSAQTGDNANLR
jgi:hypothetical protein